MAVQHSPAEAAATMEVIDARREIVRLRSAITEAERLELLGWAGSVSGELKPNGFSRAHRKVEQLSHVPEIHTRLRERLIHLLALPLDVQPEPNFGSYLSIIREGGAVHPHVDAAGAGSRHLRCNLFLQMPEEGGLPIIEGEPMPVRERDMLGFFASEARHASQPVDGGRSRVILSFGFLTATDYRLVLQ